MICFFSAGQQKKVLTHKEKKELKKKQKMEAGEVFVLHNFCKRLISSSHYVLLWLIQKRVSVYSVRVFANSVLIVLVSTQAAQLSIHF